jgi:peptide/nickel transport system substrate-binding protein
MVIARLRLIAALLAASILATPALADKRNNSIRFAIENVLDNIDPYFNTLRTGLNFAYHVWDTLIYRDPITGEYKGQLATSWKQIDEKTIELELRQGVKFHNGAEFDADDVVHTVEFVTKPENKIVAQNKIAWIDHAEKIDKYKVRIVAKESFPVAIDFLSVYLLIFPHEYHAKVGTQGMNEKPVGTGPFRVTEHARGKYIRMERNPDYFKGSPRGQPKIDRLEIRFIPDQQTQIAELLSGGVDMIWNVPIDQAQQLRAVPNLQVASGDTLRVAFVLLNASETTPAPPLRDVRVRRAIMHAINREAMLKSLVPEGAKLLHVFCHPSQFGCIDEGAPHYAYDPAKARQLLAEAGFPNGFEIDLYAYRDRAHIEAMIGYLRAVGIRANLRFLQLPAMQEAHRSGKVAMVHWTWGPSVFDVSATTPIFFGSYPDDLNRDNEVRDLLARADKSLDPDTRKQNYGRALALIEERAYALPLYSIPVYYVANKDLAFRAYSDEVTRFWEMSWK